MGFNRQQVPKYQNAAAKSKGVATPQKPQMGAQQANMANALRSFMGGQATQPQQPAYRQAIQNARQNQPAPQFDANSPMGRMFGGGQSQSPMQMPQRPQPMQQASQAPQRRMGGKGGRSRTPNQYRGFGS